MQKNSEFEYFLASKNYPVNDQKHRILFALILRVKAAHFIQHSMDQFEGHRSALDLRSLRTPKNTENCSKKQSRDLASLISKKLKWSSSFLFSIYLYKSDTFGLGCSDTFCPSIWAKSQLSDLTQ